MTNSKTDLELRSGISIIVSLTTTKIELIYLK
jgi:hypothetical protein